MSRSRLPQCPFPTWIKRRSVARAGGKSLGEMVELSTAVLQPDGTKVMLLASDPGAAEGHRLKLELDGYVVEVVVDAGEALRRIRRAPPDLLFVDVVSAPAQGEALLQELESKPVSTWFPVVVITPTAWNPAVGQRAGHRWTFELANLSGALPS